MKAHLITKTGFILVFLLAIVAPAAAAAPPTDTLGTNLLVSKRLQIYSSLGPGHPVQVTLPEPPQSPVLVTIQDYLGTTRYQQWHAPDERITIRFQEPVQPLPPGMYLVIVSSSRIYLKEKFIFQ